MVVLVDVEKRRVKMLETRALGPIAEGFSLIKEFGVQDPTSPKNPFYLGYGPFVDTRIPGSGRGVAVFRSPLTGGLFVSTAGGLGLYIGGTDALAIVGRSEKPLVIHVLGNQEVEVRIYEVDGINEIFEEKGAYGVVDFLKKEIGDGRPVVVGPAAFNTYYGALLTVDPVMKVDDWFGRGGAGTALAIHNVVGIVFTPEELPTNDEIYRAFEGAVGNIIAAASAATTKYRFVKDEGMGGTIINWAHLKEMLPVYNWKMIYMEPKERERIYEEKVLPLVEELKRRFASGKILSKTCGERCPAACKKVDVHKRDYEPHTALGTQLGIFNLDLIGEVVETADRLGFDAIQVGNVVSWAFEASDNGFLEAPGTMNIEKIEDEKQAEAAKTLLKELAFGERPEISKGIRRFGKKEASDLAVYVPFKGGGEIVPPKYWVPGFLIPLPLHGKFMTYYGAKFLPPRELGREAWKRFVREFMLENSGFCRFHRKWAEEALIKVYKQYGIDALLHHEALASRIALYNKDWRSLPPESKRSIDLIVTFYELWDDGKEVAKNIREKGIEWFISLVREGISDARTMLVG